MQSACRLGYRGTGEGGDSSQCHAAKSCGGFNGAGVVLTKRDLGHNIMISRRFPVSTVLWPPGSPDSSEPREGGGKRAGPLPRRASWAFAPRRLSLGGST